MTDALRTFVDAYHSGNAANSYAFLGCHGEIRDGIPGFVFRVWAPNAHGISVVGDFNRWDPAAVPMQKISQGIWEGWSPDAYAGSAYKFYVRHWNGHGVYKTDPFAFRTCRAPDTSGIICAPSSYAWGDGEWMRRRTLPLNRPVNIYEVHLGSWRRKEDGSLYSYSELAPILAGYVRSMGYTHVELMPLCESPNDPSLGYQVTGYFSPTSRYGAPEELMELVDTLHQAGIGVILDWMASHFPKDEHGLFEFDGTCTYEVSDPDTNEMLRWDTRIFDLGKPEVKSFLISSAQYWLEVFHMDGIRVDAVSTMLYLDEGRKAFKPNRYGGRENLKAMEFLRQLNRACYLSHPSAMMCASVEAPQVTVPNFDGGLGFLFNWDLPWTNAVLSALRGEARPDAPTFDGNHILALSHDEVSSGKCGLITRMPGSYGEQFARMRLLRGLQMTTPGKKLQFMGAEFAQFIEWNWRQGLDWMLLNFDSHRCMHAYTRELNRFYLSHGMLWENDFGPDAITWLRQDSLSAFLRRDAQGREVLVVCNFSPDPAETDMENWAKDKHFAPVFCSDERRFGGSGTPFNDLSRCVPPLSLTIFATP